MIITIFFAIASISLIIFVPIYLKKKNNLYKYKPQEKMSLKKQKKTIKNIWELGDFANSIFWVSNKYVMIIELGSIEYKLMNDEEQDNIDNNLMKISKTFKNQVQFFSTIEKIDTSYKVEEIRNNINKQKNSNIKEYGESIIEYLENIMQEENLYVRKNYLIIESKEPYNKALIELKEFYDDLKYNLTLIKIKTTLIDELDTIELIYRELNKGDSEKIRKIIQEVFQLKNNLWNILKKELRELFRDKKSLAMMLVIPIFIPLLVIGMSALFESQVSKDVSEYNKIGFAYEMTEEEKNIAEEMNIEIINGNEEELKEKYDNGEINLYITKQDSKYIINTDGSDNSTFASSLMETYFNTYKQYLQQSYLQENNMNPNEVLNIITVEENVLEQDNYFADYIKNYAFLFIMMAITVSATYPATDTTAGERERGTLETLLTFPIKSRDIIVGKFLGVTVSSIITGLISLALAIISLMITKNMFSIYEGMEVMYSPITILFAVIVIIAYSFFISGLCIAIASTSKTFKEAQSALTPLTFISFFPGMIAFMMGITTTPILSIVPFLNFTLIFTDINNGTINLLNIGLMAISTIIYISLVFAHIIKQYKSEKVLFAK